MNIETYLKELQKRLALLNKTEIDKISGLFYEFLAKKVSEGLTEEEAIASLGDVNDVARTILEAYKINEQYIKIFVGKEKIIDNIGDFSKKVRDQAVQAFNKVESSLKTIFKKTTEFGENLFTKKEKDEEN